MDSTAFGLQVLLVHVDCHGEYANIHGGDVRIGTISVDADEPLVQLLQREYTTGYYVVEALEI